MYIRLFIIDPNPSQEFHLCLSRYKPSFRDFHLPENSGKWCYTPLIFCSTSKNRKAAAEKGRSQLLYGEVSTGIGQYGRAAEKRAPVSRVFGLYLRLSVSDGNSP